MITTIAAVVGLLAILRCFALEKKCRRLERRIMRFRNGSNA